VSKKKLTVKLLNLRFLKVRVGFQVAKLWRETLRYFLVLAGVAKL